MATASAPHAPDIEKLPGGVGLLAEVVQRARAAAEAQYLYEATEAPSRISDLTPAIERLRAIRVQYLADANALLVRDLIKADQIAEVTNSNGHRSIAYDVQRLCTVMRAAWSRIQGRTAFSLQDLDESQVLAESVEAQVATRERNEKTRAEASIDRQRAFTLLDISYDRLQKLLGFVRWDMGDIASFAPSLNVNKGRRRSSEDAEAEDGEGVAVPSPVVGNGTGGNGAAPNGSSSIAAQPAFPGGGPFGD